MAQRKHGNISLANYLVNTKMELHQTLDSLLTKVNWSPFEALLSPIHSQPTGRKSYPALLMFKCLLLQNWYNLSDYDLEKTLDDRLSFRRFVGLDYTESVPDHSSFSRFRDELLKHNLEDSLFRELSQQIEHKGLIIKKGTLIDASIVQADVRPPASRSDGKGGSSKTDRDATWTKKRNKSYFGYKMHVGVDEGSGFVRKRAFNPAHVHDTNLFCSLVSQDEEFAFADKAYASSKNDRFLRERGINNGILFKREQRSPVFQRFNHHASKVRSQVETVFGALKRNYGYRRVRYRSLLKNCLQFTLLCICYNLRKLHAF